MPEHRQDGAVTVLQGATLGDMATATTPDERALRSRLRGYARRRAAHDVEQVELDAELAAFVADARRVLGSDYGSVTLVAELAGVSRATVHRALARAA